MTGVQTCALPISDNLSTSTNPSKFRPQTIFGIRSRIHRSLAISSSHKFNSQGLSPGEVAFKFCKVIYSRMLYLYQSFGIPIATVDGTNFGLSSFAVGDIPHGPDGTVEI